MRAAAAARSATESDAGCTGARLSVIPTRASGPPPARSARDRQPVREQQVVRDAQRRRPSRGCRAP